MQVRGVENQISHKKPPIILFKKGLHITSTWWYTAVENVLLKDFPHKGPMTHMRQKKKKGIADGERQVNNRNVSPAVLLQRCFLHPPSTSESSTVDSMQRQDCLKTRLFRWALLHHSVSNSSMLETELPGRRPRGRPERRFRDAVKEDTQVAGVRVEDTEKRVKWKTGKDVRRRSSERQLVFWTSSKNTTTKVTTQTEHTRQITVSHKCIT